jgi:hypothetical protein
MTTQTYHPDIPFIETPEPDDHMAEALFGYQVFCREARVQHDFMRQYHEFLFSTPDDQLESRNLADKQDLRLIQ